MFFNKESQERETALKIVKTIESEAKENEVKIGLWQVSNSVKTVNSLISNSQNKKQLVKEVQKIFTQLRKECRTANMEKFHTTCYDSFVKIVHDYKQNNANNEASL